MIIENVIKLKNLKNRLINIKDELNKIKDETAQIADMEQGYIDNLGNDEDSDIIDNFYDALNEIENACSSLELAIQYIEDILI